MSLLCSDPDFDQMMVADAVENGSDPVQAAAEVAAVAERSADIYTEENTFVAADAAAPEMAIEIAQGEAVMEADRAAVAAVQSDDAPSPFGGANPFGAAAVNPSGGGGFEVAEADPAEEVTPAASPSIAGGAEQSVS